MIQTQFARSWPFTLLLLASGYCGLSYEVLFGRLLGNAAGEQFAVSAAILIAFLLGIGLGARYAYRLWRHLWLIEAGIGLCGVALALGVSWLDPLLHNGLPGLEAGLGNTVLVCVLVLLPPAFLIGCGMPLFAGYLERLHPAPGFSRAYAFYNLGAALTVLLMEYWLLREFGLRTTTLLAATVNGCTALVLRWHFNALRMVPERSTEPDGADLDLWSRAALGVAGIGSAIFQLLMVRMAELLLGPFREHFALVLVLILLGLTMGSVLVQRYRLGFSMAMGLCLLGLAGLAGGLEWGITRFAGGYYAIIDTSWGLPVMKFLLLLALMVLPAIGFGATLPALLSGRGEVARTSGRLLFLVSMANVTGFLVMVFVLHPRLDYGTLVLVVAGCAALAWILYATQAGSGSRRWQYSLALLLLSVVVWMHHLHWEERLFYLGHTSFHKPRDIPRALEELRSIDVFKGPQDVMAIKHSGRPFFLVNGSVSIPLDSAAEVLVGAFAAAFSPRLEQAMVLGVGSGKTASAVAQLFDNTDAVEINTAILKNLHRLGQYNFDLHRRSGIRFHLDDAIHYVRNCTTRYDLVLNTVMTPLYFSSSKLYTEDFFASVHNCLKPDGVYLTWIDANIGDEGVRIILKTLESRFPFVVMGMVRSSYYLLLASSQPVQLHGADRVPARKVLRDHLLEQDEILAEWVPYSLFHTDPLAYVRGQTVPVNTLDRPVLEFSMAGQRMRGFRQFRQWLADTMDVAAVGSLLGTGMRWRPEQQALYLAGRARADDRLVQQWNSLARQRDADFDRDLSVAQRGYWDTMARRLDTAHAYRTMASRLQERGEYAASIPLLHMALDRSRTGRDEILLKLAHSQEQTGQWEQALEGYRAILVQRPRHATVRYRAGRVLTRMGRYRDAVPELVQALADGGHQSMDRLDRREVLRWFRKAWNGVQSAPNAVLP
jgi:predicted membrane-bound spermidine synthase